MFWKKLLFIILIGTFAWFLTPPLSSFSNPTAFLSELNSNTGQVLLWVLALFGAAGLAVREWDSDRRV